MNSSRVEVYNIVNDVLSVSPPWVELPVGLDLKTSWNLLWTWSKPKVDYTSLLTFQKVNHFPGSWCIGRKDRLQRCINRAKRFHSNSSTVPPDAFSFIPGGWILPSEYPSWSRSAAASPRNIYIIKPSASSCGRGIRLIHKNNLASVPKDKPCVVQQYLHQPYLINK